VCWCNGFLSNYQCSIAVIKLQFAPICRPLASAAWCGLHPPRYASDLAAYGLLDTGWTQTAKSVFPELAQNSLRLPWVFHVQRNPRVFQVFQVCGHPVFIAGAWSTRHVMQFRHPCTLVGGMKVSHARIMQKETGQQLIHETMSEGKTSGYATWFTAGGAICIAHYDVIDDVITRKV